MKNTCDLIRPPGLIPYAPASEVMRSLAARRSCDEIPDTLILLEHSPVYTFGRRSNASHLLWSEERIRNSGAELHAADRGGSFTFHGPGQLVGYPIMKLESRLEVIRHLRRLEEVVIRSGAAFGLELERDPERTGAWAGGLKVCAIGVRLSAGRVTSHGFGLNCATDLTRFGAIVPCGLPDRGVASLSNLAGRRIGVEDVLPVVIRNFSEVFEVDVAARASLGWPAQNADPESAAS